LLITNGGMFLQLLKPPYTEQNMGERFLVFERVHTEPDTFINTSRFKNALQNSEVRGPYIFDERNNAFVLIDHGPLSTNQTQIEVDLTKAVSSAGPYAVPALYKASPTECTLENLTNGDFLKLTGFTISPTAVDYIEFEYLCEADATKKGVITAAWKIPELGTKGTAATVIWPQSRWQKARIHLSHYWRWYATKEIPELYLLFFPTKKLELRNVRLVSSGPAPEVAVNVPPTELGVRFVDAENIALLVKTQHIPEAKSIDLEISKPNYFFDSFYYTDQNPALAESLRMETPGGDRPIKLVPKSVPTSAYYQIRVRAFDKTGHTIGEPSDAITLFVRR